MAKQSNAPKPVTYRCDRGHEWKSNESVAKNMIALPIGMAGTIERVCPHCLLTFISFLLNKQNIGRVTVKDESE